MSAITLEILKITVGAGFQLTSPAFAQLRQTAFSAGVKDQWYGMIQGRQNLLCWLIEWPVSIRDPLSYAGSEPSKFNFRDSIRALDAQQSPTSWLLPFENADLIRPALTAPVCEICDVNLKPGVNRTQPDIAKSLHKTFTDCYDAPDGGFTGGYWAVNARNDRHNVYLLGWESRELHAKYFATPLCALELKNLDPYNEGGEGLFINLTHERNE
ncbi:hypothetical protein GGG16DRAFT_110086 [Schizophyllum commune]